MICLKKVPIDDLLCSFPGMSTSVLTHYVWVNKVLANAANVYSRFTLPKTSGSFANIKCTIWNTYKLSASDHLNLYRNAHYNKNSDIMKYGSHMYRYLFVVSFFYLVLEFVCCLSSIILYNVACDTTYIYI